MAVVARRSIREVGILVGGLSRHVALWRSRPSLFLAARVVADKIGSGEPKSCRGARAHLTGERLVEGHGAEQ